METAANAGAAVAMAAFRTDLTVETKDSKTDVVTRADVDAQRAVVEAVHESYPGETVVGEEEGGPKELPDSGPCWVVDPIDGTSNFVRGIGLWATSVAAVEDGEALAAATVVPALDDVYRTDGETATLNGDPVSVSRLADPERFAVAPTLRWPRRDARRVGDLCAAVVERFGDLRRFGSAQVTLAAVAAGQLEGAVSAGESHPWDTVAGVAMIRAAGGRVTDLAGERWTPDAGGLVASNDAAHEALLAAVQSAYGDATGRNP